jgi:shikimate kinase
MGTGKSSVGRRLARAQSWPHFDTDEMIESALGMSIREIFATLGEERFREEETGVLERLDATQRVIIVAGGGAVLRSQNIRRMRELGIVVCLTADLATLCARLADRHDRPLLPEKNRAAQIEALLRERGPLYQLAADLILDTSSLTYDEVAESIRRSLGLAG